MKFKRSMITLLALLLVLCLSMSFLTACNDNVQETQPSTTAPLTTEPLTTEPEPTETEPGESPEEWTGFFANCFTGSLEDYEGEIDGVSFQGLLMNQPETVTLTKSAVKALRLFARANGFDGLRVHTYVTQADDTLVVNGVEMKREVWDSTEIHLGMLNSLTQFTSYTTDESENYMWFEFIKMPVINATSFVESVVPYQGTIGGITFDGFVFRSGDYQPTAYFTEDAVEDIKAYAKENGFNALRISSYPIQNEHFFNVGGYFCLLNTWTTRDYDVTKISSDFIFWSQGGSTENYMIFEFVNSNNPLRPYGKEGPPTPSHPYFTSTGKVAVEDYNGTIEGVQFKGYKFTSSDYQPTFRFTAKGVAEIKDYAKKNNVNYLKIHSYAILNEHLFLLNGKYTETQKWCETDVYIDSLTDDFTFWSQGTNSTEIYMWFEFYYDYIPEATSEIDASYFQADMNWNGDAPFTITFSDYIGAAGDTSINGVQVVSYDYQPSFRFTADGVAAIKAYAAEHNVNFLKIHSYAILNEHFLLINGKYTDVLTWTETDVHIDALTEDYKFWSQAPGSTEIYFWFEFYYDYIPEATSEIDASYFQAHTNWNGDAPFTITFSDYIGAAGYTPINGVKVVSYDYQPSFGFTADGVAAIKAYAAEHSVNFLKIHSYAILNEHFLLINGKYTDVLTWTETDVFVDTLTEDFKFWSQAPGSTEVYLWFEFYYEDAPDLTSNITAQYFEGAQKNESFKYSLTFEDYIGEAGGTTINGVKVVSSEYQPYFKFTADGVAAIKAYAAEHNVNYLRIHSYAILNEHFLLINGTYTDVQMWVETEVDINTITEDFRFWSQAPGSTEIYFWFEYYRVDLINSDSFTSSTTNFSNYEGTVGGVNFAGVKATSSEANPIFAFTEGAVAEITAHADKYFQHTLKISVYPILENGQFRLGETNCPAGQWTDIEVNTADISSVLTFAAECTGNTEVYMMFTFLDDIIIGTGSFSGAFTAEEFNGVIGDEEIAAIKLSSTGRTRDSFTADALEGIKNYANKMGYTELKIKVYVTLDNNQFTVFGQSIAKDQWNELTISIDSLTTSSRIQTTSTGNTEAYFVFEFQ